MHRPLAIVFCATGLVFATWASRIPAVQERLGLGAGGLAVAFLALNAGAVAGLPGGGALVHRAGSRRALAAGFAVYPAALAAAALAPSLGCLVAALLVMAAANSVVDVAMNAQGVALERRLGHPALSRLHAAHSFGVLGGGLLGTAAAALGVDARAHALSIAGLVAGGVPLAVRRLDDGARAAGRLLGSRPSGRLAVLGAIAFLAFLVEGTANDWSAVHLRTERGAGPALAAAGFTAFSLAVALARLAGDRLVARLGRRRLVARAGAVAAAGAAVVMVGPGPLAALAGWVVLGAGVGVVAPTVLAAAPDAGRVPAAAAISIVSGLGYLGSFAGPPAIGALASVAGLSTAMATAVVAALLVTLLARRALPAEA